MRWLVAIALLVASRADARKIVIMEPPVAAACPTAPSWQAVLDCFKAHHLAVKIVASVDGARLLAVSDATVKDKSIEAFALYAQRGTTWNLGGLLELGGSSADLEVQKLERVTTGLPGANGGFRFDVATVREAETSIDGVSSVSSMNRTVVATFCAGNTYHCLTLTRHCSTFVHGQAVLFYDGTITFHDGHVSMAGASTTPACSSNADFVLGF